MQRVFGEVFEYTGVRDVALMDGDTESGAHGWHNLPAPYLVFVHQPETRCMRCLSSTENH